MPFEVKPDTDVESFKKLLKEYFPDIEQKIQSDSNIRPGVIKDKLFDDYARMGSYLTHTTLVLKGLEKLEAALVTKLQKAAASEKTENEKVTDVAKKVTKFTELKQTLDTSRHPSSGLFVFPTGTNTRGESISFKTHKLLSSTLEELENLHCFNGLATDTFELKQDMHLYPGAKVARNPGPAKASDPAPTKAGAPPDPRDKVAFIKLPDVDKDAPANWPADKRPVGVPAISGILGQAFNKTLLRHGYHFKDPGAGIAHGEYTHRLQWYAIVTNNVDVGLVNKPLDLFRSLGSDWCKHERAGIAKDGTKLTGYYMWEALFDCAKSGLEAAEWRPHSSTFTCPEAMLEKLTPMMLNPSDKLFVLKALMRARNTKRAGKVAGGDSTFERQDYGLRFTAGSSKSIETATGFKGAYLLWYLNKH